MPVTFDQDAKQEDVITISYKDNWTVAEFEVAYNQMVDYAAKIGRDFYMISNFLESGAVPPNVLSMAARSTRQLPDNMALIVTINSSRFVTTLMDIALKLNRDLGKKAVVVRSVEEAYTEIARRRKENK